MPANGVMLATCASLANGAMLGTCAMLGTVTELPRWVWADTRTAYPPLLKQGQQIGKCWDLRLSRAILLGAAWVPGEWKRNAPAWPGPDSAPGPGAHAGAGGPAGPGAAAGAGEADSQLALFDEAAEPDPVDVPAHYLAQLDALGRAQHSERLRLLLAAESAGALIACEIHHAGIPFDVARHNEILAKLLGPRPPAGLGGLPAIMAGLQDQVRAALASPRLNLASQPSVLRALRRAGLDVRTTSKWELKGKDHPAIGPYLRYKKLARLASANGWAWAERHVSGGRFRPTYVVGGVVTGRWASDGGGAQQFPAELRSCLVADPGWCLVVADAAQLEPRILAGLAGDDAMARAGRGKDLYEGIVASGAVATRQEAKVGMLSAMYGGTSGGGGQVLPRLRAAFPASISFVEKAAKAGEQGGQVTTLLGRTSPPPGEAFTGSQREALTGASAEAELRAQSQARAQGRFTRNFVVQGTAAEWAECWLAAVRRELALLPEPETPCRAPAPCDRTAHLVFFLHDELIVHAPASQASQVARIIEEAAAEAGRLLFGDFPVTFPLHVAAAADYAAAKE